MTYILALDIGTSALKAIAFSPEGRILFIRKAAFSTAFPEPGHAEQSPGHILAAVKKNIRHIIRDAGEPPAALSFSSAMHSLIAVDENGGALTPCLTWQDNRSKALAAGLRNSPEGQAIYRQAGPPIHPMLPLCKIRWMKENRSEIFSKAFKWVSIKSFVLFHLTGEWAEDFSLASATGLWDNSRNQWSETAAGWAGIEIDRLPPPVPTLYRFPSVQKEIARATGLGVHTPVIAGASDGCLANLGSLARHAEDLVVTVGTSSAVRINLTHPIPDEKQRIFSYWLDEGQYVVGGASNNGGGVLDWLMKQVLSRRKSDIPDMLAGTKPGPENPIFLPYLFGERAPVWDAGARAAFIGMTPQHTKAHLLRSAMEGIIFNLLAIKKILEEQGHSPKNLIANGGFAYSGPWVQMLADIFGLPVTLQENPEASAFGAALQGMKALGWISGYADAAGFVHTEKTVMPDPERRAVYTGIFPVFQALSEAVLQTSAASHKSILP